jgi:hypothetical protein
LRGAVDATEHFEAFEFVAARFDALAGVRGVGASAAAASQFKGFRRIRRPSVDLIRCGWSLQPHTAAVRRFLQKFVSHLPFPPKTPRKIVPKPTENWASKLNCDQ